MRSEKRLLSPSRTVADRSRTQPPFPSRRRRQLPHERHRARSRPALASTSTTTHSATRASSSGRSAELTDVVSRPSAALALPRRAHTTTPPPGQHLSRGFEEVHLAICASTRIHAEACTVLRCVESGIVSLGSALSQPLRVGATGRSVHRNPGQRRRHMNLPTSPTPGKRQGSRSAARRPPIS